MTILETSGACGYVEGLKLLFLNYYFSLFNNSNENKIIIFDGILQCLL